MDMQSQSDPWMRKPGESKRTIFVDRPSEFDKKFDEFVASMGCFKIIGVNFKTDEPPDGGKGKSKSAKAARRRRNRRMAQQRQQQYGETSTHWDAGDNWTTTSPSGAQFGASDQNGDDDEENGDVPSDQEGDAVLCEEDHCEIARQKTYESGKVALISISTVGGVTFLIRVCRFVKMPDKLIKMLEGKEFLKIGFGLQADKIRMYEKYGFFVLNYVDPRRPLFAWKNFVDGYHFERFGAYSVASYLFETEIQNLDAAACLSSMWSAPELNTYLKRAASRETQLTMDVYAEMCVQMLGHRRKGFSLTADVYNDPIFYDELLKVAEGHINNGFDMRDFGVKVFGTPALQRRFSIKLAGAKGGGGAAAIRDTVPDTFADRVRLRQSKSTVEKYWKTRVLYAAFDSSLFSRGTSQPVTLMRKIDDVVWEMKVEVISKVPERVTSPDKVQPLMPALGYYKKEEDQDQNGCLNGCQYADANQFYESEEPMQPSQPPQELFNYGEAEVVPYPSYEYETNGFVAHDGALYEQPFYLPDQYATPEPSMVPYYGMPMVPAAGRGRLQMANNAEYAYATEPMPPGRGRGMTRVPDELSYFAQPQELKYVGRGRGCPITSAPAAIMKKSRGPRLEIMPPY